MKRGIVFLAVVMMMLSGCVTPRQGGSPQGDGSRAAAVSAAHGDDVHITKHYEGSLTTLTADKLYSLELVVPRNEVRMGVNSLELIVHHGVGGDTPGATVTVVPWMPSMGHGVMEKPVITERGGGVYTIDNVVFSMTGHWQLKVTVDKDGKADSALFDFKEVKAMGHAHHMGGAAMTPGDMAEVDTATEKLSENKMFKVSYAGAHGAIPMNRIHSWTVRVADTAGQPVANATLIMVGDMPEHGHGLPTEPVVTMKMPDGSYTVEGVKFSMPGLWVVTFHIRAGDREDSVSFNLMLH